jgi:hypothetical protein
MIPLVPVLFWDFQSYVGRSGTRLRRIADNSGGKASGVVPDGKYG